MPSISLAQIAELVRGIRPLAHEELHHYTHLGALEYLFPPRNGESGGLTGWHATSARYMNDPEEYLFGRRALSLAFAEKSFETEDWLHREVARRLGDEESGASSSGYDTYFTCFSQAPDDLSQWRAYSQDGRGVCISFRQEQLATPTAVLLPVLYGTAGKRVEPRLDDSTPQGNFIRNVRRKATEGTETYRRLDLTGSIDASLNPDLTRALQSSISVADYDAIRRKMQAIVPAPSIEFARDVRDVLEALPPAFLAMKDENFAAEREVRLVTDTPSDSVRFTGGVPKPYARIGYASPLVPTAITLGPLASDDLTFTAIDRFIRNRLGKSYVPGVVRRSRISYRPV